MPHEFTKFFRQNHCKRKAEAEAAARRDHANQQTARREAAAAAERAEDLSAITTAATEERESINTWYQTELSKAEDSYKLTQAEFSKSLSELSQSYDELKKQIETGYCAERDKVISKQKVEEQIIEQCTISVVQQAEKTDDYYGQYNFVLDKLWHQAETETLHKQCVAAYLQLKQPQPKLVKTKHYSLLIAYLRQLSKQDLGTDADFVRYKKFLDVLCNAETVLDKNADFVSMDTEINGVLERAESKNSGLIYAAYKSDATRIKNSYAESLAFNAALHDKVAKAKDEVAIKYAAELADLTKQKTKKEQDLASNVTDIEKEITTNKQAYQSEYDAYISSLTDKKGIRLHEVDASETQEKAKVEARHRAEVQEIRAAAQRKLQEIDASLQEELQKLKRSRLGGIANLAIAVGAGVLAWCSGGVLAGASAYLIDIVQTSLGLTSLGAAANLLQGKDEFGVKVSANVFPSRAASSFKSRTATSAAAPPSRAAEDAHSNLAAIRAKFKALNKDVEAWQAEEEHNLLYRLNKNLAGSLPNFSDTVTLFSKKDSATKAAATDFRVHLGTLRADGKRDVAWNITTPGKAAWRGSDIMRDSDIRGMVRKLSGASNDSFNTKDWEHAQVITLTTAEQRERQQQVSDLSNSKKKVTNKVEKKATIPSVYYESKTPEQFERNYGTKPTTPKVLWLYATNQLLPGDRKFVANAFGGSISEAVQRGEDQSWGHIRRAKDAVSNVIDTSIKIHEELARRNGHAPKFAGMMYANAAITKAAMTLVPDTPGQFALDVAMLVGAAPAAAGAMWLWRGVRSGAIVSPIIFDASKFGKVLFSRSTFGANGGQIGEALVKSVDIRNPVVRYASKQLPSKHQFINESKLLEHFEKHGGEFKGVYKTPEEYLKGANFVIENGHKVNYMYQGVERTAYVRFMGNSRNLSIDDAIKNLNRRDMGLGKHHEWGEAKFEFLALRNDGTIATYHTQGAENFYRTINKNSKNDAINVEHLSCTMM